MTAKPMHSAISNDPGEISLVGQDLCHVCVYRFDSPDLEDLSLANPVHGAGTSATPSGLSETLSASRINHKRLYDATNLIDSSPADSSPTVHLCKVLPARKPIPLFLSPRLDTNEADIKDKAAASSACEEATPESSFRACQGILHKDPTSSSLPSTPNHCTFVDLSGAKILESIAANTELSAFSTNTANERPLLSSSSEEEAQGSKRAWKLKEGSTGNRVVTMQEQPGATALASSNRLSVVKGLDHRRSASDLSEMNQAMRRSPQKPTSRSKRLDQVEKDGEGQEKDGEMERAIEAALIRFQWITDSKRAVVPLHSALGRINISTNDAVEMLNSPVVEPLAKGSQGMATPARPRRSSRRSTSKSSTTSLRDVFTDAGADGEGQAVRKVSSISPGERRLLLRPSTGNDAYNGRESFPSLLSTDSLDLGQFHFPPPPKTLRERHSHGCLRSADGIGARKLVHPTEPSPPLLSRMQAPLTEARSPLRERRSKPPLHLALDRKGGSLRKQPLPSPDPTKPSSCASPFSPPPCPPPRTPLPELPTPSSEDLPNRPAIHSRKGSAVSAPTESRRSSNSSDSIYGTGIGIGFHTTGPGGKNLAQMRKRSFNRAHSASPSTASISATFRPHLSRSGGSGSSLNLFTPPPSGGGPVGGARTAFSPTHAAYPTSKPITCYEHASSEDFFKLLEQDGGPLSPPPSAGNADQRQRPDRTKLHDLFQCLSPSVERESLSAQQGCVSGTDRDAAAAMQGSVQGARAASIAMARIATDPEYSTRPSQPATQVGAHRLSHPIDVPLGTEGEDQIVYGLAL